MPLKLNSSSGGSVTLQEPTTASNRTLTLPDATGTVNTSGAVNEVPAGSASAPSIFSTGDTNTGIFFPAADTIAFTNGGTEAARIDSSRNLLVGTTTANGLLSVARSSDASTTHIYNTTGTFSATNFVSRVDRAATTAYVHAGFNSNGTVVCYIYGNGNLQNTNNSYAGISDIKLKENVVDASPKLASLMQMRVVNYNFKPGLGYEQHKQIGLVAQEVEQVFPGLVEETADRDADGSDLGTTTKSVKYSVFVPMLIKAIQEQQAMIEELKAKVAALEAK